MWLLWLEPEPALRNENIPAIRRLDFVHRHSVWSGKNRCCLAVLAGAAGKRTANRCARVVRCVKGVCTMADKALVDYGTVLHLGVRGEYKAFEL